MNAIKRLTHTNTLTGRVPRFLCKIYTIAAAERLVTDELSRGNSTFATHPISKKADCARVFLAKRRVCAFKPLPDGNNVYRLMHITPCFCCEGCGELDLFAPAEMLLVCVCLPFLDQLSATQMRASNVHNIKTRRYIKDIYIKAFSCAAIVDPLWQRSTLIGFCFRANSFVIALRRLRTKMASLLTESHCVKVCY